MRCFRFLTLVTGALVLFSFDVKSQLKITGTVISEKDKSPIPFASIGMINTGVGTISEIDGRFEIEIPQSLINKELVFSALGYERQNVSVVDMTSGAQLSIALIEKAIELAEVAISAKTKLRRFEFGNRDFDGGAMYAHAQSAGSAIVVLVDNKDPVYANFSFPARLDKLTLRVINNTFGEFKFRLRIYSVLPNGRPGRDILNKDVMLYDNVKNGWITFDLSENNIKPTEPFFIGVEWILDAKDRAFLHKQYTNWQKKHPELVTQESTKVNGQALRYTNYNGTMWAGTSLCISSKPEKVAHQKCFFRYNSFGEWFPSPVALTARILLLN